MTESYKKRQKTIHTILAIITLISIMSPEILKAANLYLSPETAATVSFFVVIVAALVNQISTNKRVTIAEVLKDEEYTEEANTDNSTEGIV
jgi:hypothetical protein